MQAAKCHVASPAVSADALAAEFGYLRTSVLSVFGVSHDLNWPGAQRLFQCLICKDDKLLRMLVTHMVLLPPGVALQQPGALRKVFLRDFEGMTLLTVSA